MQHGQHGDVGLACTCWSCYEEVFISVVCCIKDHTLDPVQTLGASERQLCDLVKLADLHPVLPNCSRRGGASVWDGDLLHDGIVLPLSISRNGQLQTQSVQ